MPTWGGVYVKLLRDADIDPPAQMVKEITPLGNAGAADYCIAHGLNMKREKILEIVFAEFERMYLSTIVAKPFVKEALLRLRSEGARLHVLTASSHAYVDPCLKKEGIFELFDNVWSSDDFPYTKAQAQIYTAVAQRLAVAPCDCAFFDDNLIAIETATAVGMFTVGVYDASSALLAERIQKAAHKYVRSFEELLS